MIPESAISDAEQAARRIMNAFGGNRAEIRIDAGGIGVILAASACAIMLACGVIGALWASHELARIDREMAEVRARAQAQQAYLNAIYQAAPQLKPEK